MVAGEAGFPDLVQIRARSRVVEAGISAVIAVALVLAGVVGSEGGVAIVGTILFGCAVLFSWMPCVVFGPEEMVVTNAFRSLVVRYYDVTAITFNGWTSIHNRSLVLVSRTHGWVSVDAVRRRMLMALIGLDDQSGLIHAEIERRVQLARSRS